MTRFRAIVAVCCCAVSGCSFLVTSDDLVGGAVGARPGSPDLDGVARDAAAGDGASSDGATSSADGSSDTSDDTSPVIVECSNDGACDGGNCIDGWCRSKPEPVVPGGAAIFGIAVTPGEVFYAHVDEILRKPLDGGLAQVVDDAGGAHGDMALDDSYLYFPDNGSIYRMPRDGGDAISIYDGPDSPITAVAVVTDRLYFTLQGALWSMAKIGGSARVVVSGFNSPSGLSAHGTSLYVADRLANTVTVVEVGSDAGTVLFPNVPNVRSAFIDPPYAWMTTSQDGDVYRARIDGTGTLERIASGQPFLEQIVATSSHVYWAAGATVVRVPR